MTIATTGRPAFSLFGSAGMKLPFWMYAPRFFSPAIIRSPWLVQSAAEEQAEVAALNEREQADMETAEELAGAGDEKEWESDDDSMSDFQATRRDISMLNSCRRVESFERLNRISEGTYGVVYR